MGKALGAGILVVVVGVPTALFLVLFASVEEVLGHLTIKPQAAVVVDALDAASTCPISGSTVLSSAVLLGASYAINGGGVSVGTYRNPWGRDSDVPAQFRNQAARDLARGGRVDSELNVGGKVTPGEWTTLLPESRGPGGIWVPDPSGEHGFGFLLLEPSQWTSWSSQVPGGGAGLDPFQPVDAMKALACHLRSIERSQHLDIRHLGQTALFQPLSDLGDLLPQVQYAVAGKYATIWSQLRQAANDAQPMNVFQQVWSTLQQAVQSVFHVIESVVGTVTDMGARFLQGVSQALTPVVDASAGGLFWEPSALALRVIPASYLQLYERWGSHFGIDWTILAGIGTVESGNGQSNAPGVHSGANAAGAEGPMQFEPGTFAAYAVDAEGNGAPNVYDPADAIATAAHLLQADGLTSDSRAMEVLCHYNAGGGAAYQACMAGENPYPALVMAAAKSYRGAAVATGGATTLASNLPWEEIPLSEPVGAETEVPTPIWPAGTAAHVSPPAVTNQCVAGALWTWAVMHAGDPRWNAPPMIPAASAYQMYASAATEGFQETGPTEPVVGSMVVYASAWGGPADGAGHVATVIGVQGPKFEVIEQNLVASSGILLPTWGVFDVRIDQAGSRGILGFIVSPP